LPHGGLVASELMADLPHVLSVITAVSEAVHDATIVIDPPHAGCDEESLQTRALKMPVLGELPV